MASKSKEAESTETTKTFSLTVVKEIPKIQSVGRKSEWKALADKLHLAEANQIVSFTPDPKKAAGCLAYLKGQGFVVTMRNKVIYVTL